jgi:hypothetical protein
MPTALGGHGFLDAMATQSRGHGTHQLRRDALARWALPTLNPEESESCVVGSAYPWNLFH